jgi:hypothetical protein
MLSLPTHYYALPAKKRVSEIHLLKVATCLPATLTTLIPICAPDRHCRRAPIPGEAGVRAQSLVLLRRCS